MSVVNANMVTSSFDRDRGDIRGDAIIAQPYNNFTVQTTGAPIIQGQINKISVSEIFFPYAIPTVVRDVATNSNHLVFVQCSTFTKTAGTITTTDEALIISLPQGFYTGQEMATAIQDIIDASTIPGTADLKVSWDDTNSRIRWLNQSVYTGADGVPFSLFSIIAFIGGGNFRPALQRPCLAWTLGLRSLAALTPPVVALNRPLTFAPYSGVNNKFNLVLTPKNYPNDGGSVTPQLPIFPEGYYSSAIVGSPYSGRYTDYIDVVSPSLCAYQYVRDGNTNQNVIKRDILCRIYIADDNSYPPNFETGSRPFLIHRQFPNPKVLKWTAERSIDAIDLELYDMYGQPLPTGNFATSVVIDEETVSFPTITAESSDYAITFLVHEPGAGEQSANIGYKY